MVRHWPFKRRNVHYRVKPLKFIKNLFSNFAATRAAKKCPWRWEEVCSKKTFDNNWPSTIKMMTDDRSVSSKLVPTELLLIPRAIYKQKKNSLSIAQTDHSTRRNISCPCLSLTLVLSGCTKPKRVYLTSTLPGLNWHYYHSNPQLYKPLKRSCHYAPSKLFSLIWVLLPVKIISLILSRVNQKVGRKPEIPEKKHLTARKQNLACLTCDQ